MSADGDLERTLDLIDSVRQLIVEGIISPTPLVAQECDELEKLAREVRAEAIWGDVISREAYQRYSVLFDRIAAIAEKYGFEF